MKSDSESSWMPSKSWDAEEEGRGGRGAFACVGVKNVGIREFGTVERGVRFTGGMAPALPSLAFEPSPAAFVVVFSVGDDCGRNVVRTGGGESRMLDTTSPVERSSTPMRDEATTETTVESTSNVSCTVASDAYNLGNVNKLDY